MKVMMLDVDGVLNSRQSVEMACRIDSNRQKGIYIHDQCFCPIAISNLNVVLEDITNLWLVISSSWRMHHSLTEIKYMLSLAGLLYPWRILSATPRGSSRGEEIEKWLKKHAKEKEVHSFCILDDDDFDMHPYMKHVVKTDGDNGFQWSHVKEIKKGFRDGRFHIR